MTSSSTHRRHSPLVPLLSRSIPSGFFSGSLLISSTNTPYFNTDSTPCRMLSLMWIFMVSPCLILIFAMKFLLSFFIMFQCLSLILSLCIMYIITSDHSLSYALGTPRNAMYAIFLYFDAMFFSSLRISRWSGVELPLFSSAWASGIPMSSFALS